MADDLYCRPRQVGLDWLRGADVQTVLVVGEPPHDDVNILLDLSGDVRELRDPVDLTGLTSGVYGVFRRGRWEALVSYEGAPAMAEVSARHRHTDDGEREHLAVARDLLSDYWEFGRPLLGNAPVHVDDIAELRGEGRFGRVVEVTREASGHRVVIVVDGVRQVVTAESVRRLEGDPRDPAFWASGAPAGASAIGRTLTWAKLRNPLSDTLYSFATSRTVFRAYQFRPAIKILNSPHGRLLIADEVGLGKTIEAGLVWTELEQRSALRRTLVVTPSSLTRKWQMEMERRFDRRLDRITPGDLAEYAEDLRENRERELHGIISFESLRRADAVLEALTEIRPQFDLVIVDEAHAFRNEGTRSHVLGGLLSDWSDYLLFLSATPINLRAHDLFNLLNLLDGGLFASADVFQLQLEPNQHLNAVERGVVNGVAPRSLLPELDAIHDLQLGGPVTARPDFQRLRYVLDTPGKLDAADRAEVKRLVAELNTLSGVMSRTRKVDVPDAKAVREPRDIEVQLTGAEKDFYEAVHAHLVADALRRGLAPGFALQMPLRQAASCMPAMQTRMLSPASAAFHDSLADFDEEIAPEDVGDLSTVPVLARPLGVDSKLIALRARLLELRSKGQRQVLLFSTFRATIRYLNENLREDFSVRVMHGGVPMEDRQAIIDDFRDGVFEVLIASEVGSEGLDFQFCNVLVNYDLPWNPMRVEQRIGRLDRFGQKSDKIFIFNMHVPGTIETDILARLYARIDIFRNSIGDLEPILQDSLKEINDLMLDPRLSPEQRRRRADEVATAIEVRRHDLASLEDNRASIAVLDQVSVDGMSDTGPTDGRYVGVAEVRDLLDVLHRAGDLELTPAGGERFVLRGTHRLREALYKAQDDRERRRAPSLLLGRISAGEAVNVTFDAELASGRDVEFISARHALVQVALSSLEADPLGRPRYGRVRVPALPRGSRYVVKVELMNAGGIRPRTELWITAVDVDSGRTDDTVGAALLEALASGDLQDAPDVGAMDMTRHLRRLDQAAFERLSREEPQRRAENTALVESRAQAREASQRLKIAKAEVTLADVRAKGRDIRVVRLQQGRLRNLKAGLASISEQFTPHREFSMRTEPIALLDVVGAYLE